MSFENPTTTVHRRTVLISIFSRDDLAPGWRRHGLERLRIQGRFEEREMPIGEQDIQAVVRMEAVELSDLGPDLGCPGPLSPASHATNCGTSLEDAAIRLRFCE